MIFLANCGLISPWIVLHNWVKDRIFGDFFVMKPVQGRVVGGSQGGVAGETPQCMGFLEKPLKLGRKSEMSVSAVLHWMFGNIMAVSFLGQLLLHSDKFLKYKKWQTEFRYAVWKTWTFQIVRCILTLPVWLVSHTPFDWPTKLQHCVFHLKWNYIFHFMKFSRNFMKIGKLSGSLGGHLGAHYGRTNSWSPLSMAHQALL